MAQKRGLNKTEATADAPAPKRGGPRKTVYAIDLAASKDAINRLADLYGKKPAAVITDLTALYVANSLSPHFAKLQSGYAAERRQTEEDALRDIAPLFAGSAPAAQDNGFAPDIMGEPHQDSSETTE